MRQKLCNAIDSQRLVEFRYRNKDRVVEPHKVGRTTKGNVVLSGFQVGGAGNEITPPDWGLYRLDKIGALNVSTQTFSSPRPEYSPTDRRMTEIYCRL
ncbi:WYL domain-containing protein [Haloferax alexandrinus]|uniref:WYL domain-containing protein n=1 Tax=Haloferax volcanii TaxID=2246 RepID=A0A847TKU3_HALVO|nr:WYL domain-containing protein [Haloferax alexandrinus]NLV03633.1 WYL domain-containing protein [Haloferax alexandrinus]